MDTELLSCRRLTVGVVYPPFALDHVRVNRIYAQVTEKYPYQQLQHLPDGARMSNPNGDFFIQTARLQVNENIDYFHSTKDKAMDMLSMAQEMLRIPQFSSFGVKITAMLRSQDNRDAAEILESTIFKNVRKSLDKLDGERKGVGMRAVIHREGIHEIKIEPFFADLNQIYIDLDVQYPRPFSDITSIEPKLLAAYNYLFGEIRSFLEDL